MTLSRSSGPALYAVAGEPAGRLLIRESQPPNAPRPPRLLDRVREAIRVRHLSRRTEKSYVGWIRRYILFHGKRHPAAMGEAELAQFLTSLAVDHKVNASTRNQALGALYTHVLNRGPAGVRSPADRLLGG